MERVERAQADFEGPEHAQWLEHLDTERENMRTALAWLFTTGCVREAQRMCTALWEWWWMRGHLAEGARWLQLVLEADPDERTAARADVLSAAANLIRYQGDQRRAEGLYQESLTLNRELGNIAGIANVVSNLGYLAQERGDYEEARCLFLEGHAIRRRLGDTRLIAASLNNLAGVAMVQEDYARAEPLYDECLRLNQEASDSWWVAHTLFNLGLVALGQNHPDRAEQRFRQSLEMTCNLGYSLGILWALEGVAGVAAAQGQPEWAAQLWGATDSWRHQGSTPRTPSEERRIQRQMRVARVQVDHAIWTVAWEKGRAMSLEEAAREALHRGSKRPHSEPTTLTAREGEVAKMVALGFTNREIAAQLALSERTIDAHVSSILKKLGARSRSEIAGLCGQRDSTTASMPKATS
jgi:non-specific serine/threonine protein kinase